ncbi:extensin family protein [Paralimibaculum aggregatum]
MRCVSRSGPRASGLALRAARSGPRALQPAARRHPGAPASGLGNRGADGCRPIRRADGHISEHAAADAVGIPGFRPAGGRRLTRARGRQGMGPQAACLCAVRGGPGRLPRAVPGPEQGRRDAGPFHGGQGHCRADR